MEGCRSGLVLQRRSWIPTMQSMELFSGMHNAQLPVGSASKCSVAFLVTVFMLQKGVPVMGLAKVCYASCTRAGPAYLEGGFGAVISLSGAGAGGTMVMAILWRSGASVLPAAIRACCEPTARPLA